MLRSLLLSTLFMLSAILVQAQPLLSASSFSSTQNGITTVIDSALYYHTPGHNSNVMANSMLYDSCEMFSMPGVWHEGSRTKWVQRFDAQKNITGRYFYTYNINSPAIVRTADRLFTYTSIAGKTLLSAEYTHGLMPDSYEPATDSSARYYYYDAQGRYLYSHRYFYTVNMGQIMYAADSAWYDADGRLVKTIIRNDMPHHTNPVLTARERHWYAYDSNGRLLADTADDGNDGNKSCKKYEYDAQGRVQQIYFEQYDAIAGIWVQQPYERYVYDKAGLLVTKLTLQSNSVKVYSEDYSYDAHGQLTQRHYARFVPGSRWTETDNYYYGTVFPQQVQGVAVANVSLYPVPATTTINITARFAGAHTIACTITDMAGRTVKQWQDAPAQQYSNNLSVTDLPAGNYILTLSSGTQTATKQFMVVR